MLRCDTKYPVLLVHGTGFRDTPFLQYWGRIPKKLEREGAAVFYGMQDGWGSIENNASLLSERLNQLIGETGCEKVNIITHSKGGLDARYMATVLGRAENISSITTISAPHHGSKTMDKLMRLPRWLFRIAAAAINFLFRLMGDKHPDFYTTCEQFTTAYMQQFNEKVPQADGVYYQSYASVMAGVGSDLLMWFPYLVIKAIEGENDGLVAASSAEYGIFRGVLRGVKRRGISHLDTVDMRRKPLCKKHKGNCAEETGVWDIAETYMQIVQELKENGH